MKKVCWDSIAKIAQTLEIPANTVAKWKERKYIPPSRHHQVVSSAKKLGIEIDHELLHKQWKARET